MLNPNSRISVVLLLHDTSGSVAPFIDQLNEARRRMIEDSKIADKDLESIILIEVEFGGGVRISKPTPLSEYGYEPKTAGGDTPMGEAICESIPIALKVCKEWQDVASVNKITLILLTDGMATDDTAEATRLLDKHKSALNCHFLATNSEAKNYMNYYSEDGTPFKSPEHFTDELMYHLMKISPENKAHLLDELEAYEVFSYITSSSIEFASQSQPGDKLSIDLSNYHVKTYECTEIEQEV